MQAIPPLICQETSAIYPIDPQGEGTWIGVSVRGATLALLNNYQKSAEQAVMKITELGSSQAEKNNSLSNISSISRGKLITALLAALNRNTHIAGCDEINFIYQQLAKMPLERYQPFTLCAFSSTLNIETLLTSAGTEVSSSKLLRVFQWDGSEISIEGVNKVTTSSGKNLTSVTNSRVALFHRMLETPSATSKLSDQEKSRLHLNYHFSQTDLKSASVNMERADAHTVSVSHIKVSSGITFSYFDMASNCWAKDVIQEIQSI